ncbi:MAG: hypothetical protein KBG01_05240 [Syntrophobacterales bacterium]|jgi:hypothetical protein|nr:hypothetical protein [Syntrophobacterales bacterium]
MKKTLTTIILAGFMTLLTATFCLAEYSATGAESFPYFHLGALIIGGLSIISLRTKYRKIYMTEAMGALALYTALIALFTAPVVEAIKNIVG